MSAPARIDVFEEYGGWIRLPHHICKGLKNPQNETPNFIQVSFQDKIYFGRPLPCHSPDASIVLLSNLYTKGAESPIEGEHCRVDKVFGKIPFLESVVVEVVSGELEHNALLVSHLAKTGLKISLSDELHVLVKSATPHNSEIGLIGPQTVIRIHKEGPFKAPIELKEVPSMIDDPKSSLDFAYNRLYEMVCYPIIHREFLKDLPIGIPNGVILSGPPGVGKTHLVRRICEASGVPVHAVAGPDIMASGLGESEANLTAAFDKAIELANSNRTGVSILFLDELDSIGCKREDASAVKARIVAQLLTLMDGAVNRRKNVVIIGATNRPNALDPALRRPGRFDREIVIDPPSVTERLGMLQNMTACVEPSQRGDLDLEAVSKATIGYVAADLAALYREAVIAAFDQNGIALKLSTTHFIEALKLVGPSLNRDYRINLDPSVTLDSIGGYDAVKMKLEKLIMGPLKEPEKYKRIGLGPPRGVLLYGPPGCSKTTFAKALANTSGCNFYSINGASAFSSLVGESERIIRDTFANARMTSPSIIFIDEIDAMVGSRGSSADVVQERILSTMLNEMDGVHTTFDKPVIVLGATNRIDCIDSALLRPGRFDQILEIPLPNAEERLSILKVLGKKTRMCDDVVYESLIDKSEGWSGAKLMALVQEAAMMAYREDCDAVSMRHLQEALLIV